MSYGCRSYDDVYPRQLGIRDFSGGFNSDAIEGVFQNGFDSLADPLKTTNTSFSLLMLAVLYSVVPAMFKFVAMPLLWKYPLTEARLAEIQAEIRAKQD